MQRESTQKMVGPSGQSRFPLLDEAGSPQRGFLMDGLMTILHVLAVVVLLGNLLMAPFWRKRLAALGGAQARAAANRSIRTADLMFTLPGWVVVLATGIMLIMYRGMHGGWLHLSLLLFLVWLIFWAMLVLR